MLPGDSGDNKSFTDISLCSYIFFPLSLSRSLGCFGLGTKVRSDCTTAGLNVGSRLLEPPGQAAASSIKVSQGSNSRFKSCHTPLAVSVQSSQASGSSLKDLH